MKPQDVDSIIAEENLTDSQSATEEPVTPETPEVTPEAPEVTPETPEVPETPKDEEAPETPVEPEKAPETPVTPEEPSKSPTETIQEAQTLISNLNLTEDKIFDESGNVKPFTDVVPAGAYLASQLSPVKVTDKNGKEHEFMLISDVEKLFPEGFEAKNNLEQMRFQQAILANETAFQNAVKTYENAKVQYTKETNDLVQSRGENERIGKEYKAMAEAGLVPKIEGDANDPKFLESAAVKELNGLLEYMDKTNKELASKGLGQINSLYVAKQLRDQEATAEKKQDNKDKTIQARQEVASLSASPTPSDSGKKPPLPDVPLSRLADEIIAQEGLK